MYTLSATSLNLYLECPRCFYFKIKEKINRPSSPFSTVPTGIDNILKKYFDYYRGKNEIPPLLANKLPAKLLQDQSLISFLRSKKLSVYLKDLDLKLEGMLDDALILDDGSIVPLDNKTRGFPLKEINKNHIFQMNVYTYLLMNNDNLKNLNLKTTNLAYLANWYLDPYNLDFNNPLGFKVEIEEIKTKPELVSQTLKEIAEVLNSPLPDPSSDCSFCQYRNLGY
ncbi:MAG TPA: PD-(D/E)XK nuclease family protein [Candidatus Paceibacterota bacterium]|jgi:CRISPR/Cas system-associated exonuclease Cas4 (RecB family)|nr:PD-(D/E)XK nuclease family protein [Candidatus Paceibacterota bacterium]HRS47762.1 PD-(D/E)XK nuclease family protein [Candidatus Paceibacterota bacterium]